MLDFTLEDLSAEDVERLRTVYRPLTEAVRELIDATIRSEVDADVVAEATRRPRRCAAVSSTARSVSDSPPTATGCHGVTR